MMKELLLIAMIFCHIVDDYYLQKGILASLKQKEYWQNNAPDPLYRYDYLMALFMHSFSWACSIMLVPTLYALITGGDLYLSVFIVNVILHMAIDDLKANQKKINLIVDQTLHLLQIILTWGIFCLK